MNWKVIRTEFDYIRFFKRKKIDKTLRMREIEK